jgi:tellurite resistance protein TerC
MKTLRNGYAVDVEMLSTTLLDVAIRSCEFALRSPIVAQGNGPAWCVIVAVIAGLVVVDYLFIVRRTATPSLRDAALLSAGYAGIAIVFGVGVWVFGGIATSIEYFACYLSNEALSVDNLFVFLVILGSFAVPRIARQKVLLFGIVFALTARTGLIVIGAALIKVFDWAFYLLAGALAIMAINLTKSAESKSPSTNTVLIRTARRLVRTSENYDGDRLFTVEHGRRVLTPMLPVMVAVGGADILFAFDSIPALFGLSQNLCVIFSATAMSLMGLRQLYFLIEVLLDRMVFLPYGLAAILAFLSANLLLQALHDNNIPVVNGGNPVPVIQLGAMLSLAVIVVVLLITTAASLLSARGRVRRPSSA